MDEADKKAEELPGMLGVVEGVRAQRWPHTVDAQVWVNEWSRAIERNPAIPTDKGAMIGWFANAIMAALMTRTPVQFVKDPVKLRELRDSKKFFDRQSIRFSGDPPQRRVREIADDRYETESIEELLTDTRRHIDPIRDGVKHVPPGIHREILLLYAWVNEPWPKPRELIARQLRKSEKTIQRRWNEIVLILRKTFAK